MSYPMDSLLYRLQNVFALPANEKCAEIGAIVEHATLRELQEVFPAIVHNVFGLDTGDGVGWGLRTATEQNTQSLFYTLHQFFNKTGPMLRLCHRLLGDAIKFDVNIDMLPHKVIAMLQSGQHPIFYSDLINVDTFRRCIVSLSLNAFDFYILHFVLHGLQPLHFVNTMALQIQNERIKSVYYILVAEYLDNFMPAYPDAEVQPTNTCITLKAPQPIQMQSLQPKRQPRYLRIPSSYNNANTTVTSAANDQSGAPRAFAWRSESVMHFFIDIWLRFDIEGEHDLPGTEFVRYVRVLIKQTHFFANSAYMDTSAMAPLRKLAGPMIKTHIYTFLRSLIDRWPLDISMTVVLDLWLAYIQPWRYTMNYAHTVNGLPYEPTITTNFDGFIAENIVMYTHIFWRFLPRFERLDYSVYKNTIMLHRMSKTLAQPGLGSKIKDIERLLAESSFNCDSPHRHSSGYMRHNTSGGSGSYNPNYTSIFNESIPTMFSETMRNEVKSFIYAVNHSRVSVMRDLKHKKEQLRKKKQSQGFFRNLLDTILGKENNFENLHEFGKIPELLKQSISCLSGMFEVDLPDISVTEATLPDVCNQYEKSSYLDTSEPLNISSINPFQMSHNYSNLNLSIDPVFMPIRSDEVRFLVRCLHLVSTEINNRCGKQLQSLYGRSDFIGMLIRQLLYAPMTVKWFDKRRGCNTLFEENVPARLCLRPLASYSVILQIVISLFVGYLFWGIPMKGLMLYILMCLFYVVVLAIIT